MLPNLSEMMLKGNPSKGLELLGFTVVCRKVILFYLTRMAFKEAKKSSIQKQIFFLTFEHICSRKYTI